MGGIPEVIRHNINGYLVEPAAIDALGDALCDLLINPMQRRRLGENAYHHVKQHFSNVIGLRSLRTIYNELTSADSATKM